MPYVGLEHIPTGGSLLLGVGSAADSISTNGVFSSGDILFGKLRPQLRKCVRVQIPGYCSTDVLVLRPNAGVDPAYAGYIAQSEAVFSAAIRTEEGTKMPRCSWHDLKKVRVFFPDGAIQRKIATGLSCIDTTIEKTEALIAKHQQIKAGLMHDLFTRGVLPNGQLRPPRSEAPELYQETAMGWIPCNWQVAPIDSTLSRVIDYRGKTPEKTVSGVPLITVKNVRMGYIDPEPREFIAESDYARWMTRGIPGKGDVLFTTEAPLGNVAQVPTDEPMAYAQRAIILQPAPHIDAAFLAYRLMTEETQQAIQRLASGSTALGIKQSEFRKVLVAYPFNKQEQVDVVRRMQEVDAFLDAQGNIRWKLQQQKLGLMQDLLTGRVPVPVPAEAAA